ncbi:MAG: hypothetical protein A2293_07590 [Elusimicrobia bacterium RIFOXYB2_FULL_49_7]|nr:MAG: hypothetical protein A2293_07590 [Elusimicrobia bacterium RIFOXYB2_FULL_49_7]
MKKILLLLLCLPVICFSKVIIIPIDGEIDPALLTFLKRAVAEAEKQHPEAILFEINTFGGRVDAAFDIVELISTIKIPTVAFVKEKAISAGCLIALSCRDLVMMENTTLGDVAPIMMSQEGPQMLGEKFQSPLRAKFRSLAEKNHYPIKLSEAFVSTEKEIVEVTFPDSSRKILTGVEYNDLTENEKKNIIRKQTLVPKGELLTLSANEAERLGFSRKTVRNLDDAISFIKADPKDVVRIEKKRSDKLLIWMNKIAPLLILIGLFGIYMEIKTPGFGFYGFLGIASFALFFGTQYIVGLADYIEILIFIAGLTLLFIELFIIPGFGIFGVSGIALILISTLLAMQSFVIPKMPWDLLLFKKNLMTIGILFLLSIPLFLLALFSATRLARIKGLGHQTSEQTASGFIPGKEDYTYLLGRVGTTITPLRPAGAVDFEGKRMDVISDGAFIERQEQVAVSEITGNRIMVRRITGQTV